MTDLQKLAIAYGASRIAYALALIAAPKQAAGPWLGPDAASGGGKVATRALAVRDGALGAGVAAAALNESPMRPWLFACIASDLVDATATWREREDLPERAGLATLAVAGGMAAAGAALALAAEQ
ncbi:MAG TPA: hypothetical protein VD766_14075 [Solirubrobacterales bacterium]|nr:hypothetical protein [Solirubrobacterales bacterium]